MQSSLKQTNRPSSPRSNFKPSSDSAKRHVAPGCTHVFMAPSAVFVARPAVFMAPPAVFMDPPAPPAVLMGPPAVFMAPPAVFMTHELYWVFAALEGVARWCGT